VSAEAAAGTVDAAAEVEPDSESELGAVIVTARRRNESAQEVPVAISALSGDALESKGNVNLQSFHKEVPSITSYSSNARNTTINIRGLGTGTAASGNGLDSGVGFYVDDVYYARLSQSILNLVDIDHIEVLRGPQGTLFGRNTTAGAISVVTKAPSLLRQEGSVDISLGNYRYAQARGQLSTPIIDKMLAARISFEAQRRDGWTFNTHQLGTDNNQESFTTRAQLLWQTTDKLKWRLIGDYTNFGQRTATTAFEQAVEQYDDGTPLAYPWRQRIANFPYYTPLPFDPGARKSDNNRQRLFRVELGGVSLRGDWDLGPITATTISAFRFWNTNPRNDNDGTTLDVVRENNADDRQKQFTQELRVASNGKQAVDYVGGLYFLWQTVPTLSRRDFGNDGGEYNIAPGTQGLTPEQRRETLRGAYTRAWFEANTFSVAPFAQATWHILDNTDLTAGLRYTYERKWGSYEQKRYKTGGTDSLNEAQLAQYNQFNPEVPYYKLDKSWGNFSGLATLSQKLGQDKLVFITYSRGSKSGGINLANLPKDENGRTRTELAYLKPETVDHYELGLKTQWFERKLTVNANAFFTEIRGYQDTIRDQSQVVAINYLTNVGTVRSKGLELELRARPIPGLSFYAAGTFNPTEYTRYRAALCPWERRPGGRATTCDLSGEQLPVAPKYAGSAGGEFGTDITSSLRLFLGADVSYRSSYTTTNNNSRYSRIDPVTLVNARVGLKGTDGKWEALVWSQNLFDSLYFLQKSIDEQTGLVSGLLGDPRTFGGTLRYYFD
jgi:iron complex outermembrane receptor protein